MMQGHMDQEWQHKNSTKPKEDLPHVDDTFPLAPLDGTHIHFCYATMFELTGQIYTNQTGKFVAPSSTGNNYILILYVYDSNAILAVPFKSHKSESILNAYKAGHAQLCAMGLHPQLQCLNNEASWALQDHMTTEGIDYQLIPPNLHCHNAAERAIHTFKNHFIARLCSTNKDFPIHLWDWLLPQAELSLNLSWGSCINPSLSAWVQIHRPFDFNHTPIAPPGIRVLVHDKPTKQHTWAPHGSAGWYLGLALQSYQCYTI